MRKIKEMRIDIIEKICVYTRKWIAILVIGCISSLFNISAANASVATLTSSSGSSAVYDNTSNEYWIGALGSLGSIDWTYGNVTSQILYLNTANYFGINNWHLASEMELNNLFANNSNADIASNFESDNSSSGTANTGISIYFTRPDGTTGSYCVFGPCLSINYTDTHWYGIYDSATTDFHYAKDLVYRVYADTLPPEYYVRNSWSYDAGYFYGGDAEPIYGAWVVGSPSTATRVPEPATLFLFASGLVGLIAGRRMFRRHDG